MSRLSKVLKHYINSLNENGVVSYIMFSAITKDFICRMAT